MKNLAGETRADLHILEELDNAGIKVVEGPRSDGEVPYTLTGKLCDWNFSRAWYYWIAHSKKGNGLPLEVALELHNKEYRVKGKRNTYGNVIRVDGSCGCPTPTKIVRHYNIDTQEGLNALADTICNLHKMTSSGNNPKRIKQLHDKISALYNKWELFSKNIVEPSCYESYTELTMNHSKLPQQPESVEWFKKLPTIVYADRTVNELIVGISDRSYVVSIAKKWKDNEQGFGGIAQYFFNPVEGISGFNYGNFSGPGQPLNRGPEIDAQLRPHFEELKSIRPLSAPSLELYLRLLEMPGPSYTER